MSSSGGDFFVEEKEIDGCFIDAWQLRQWLALVVPEELKRLHIVHLCPRAPIKRVQTLNARLELEVLQVEEEEEEKEENFEKAITHSAKSKAIVKINSKDPSSSNCVFHK